MINKKNDIRSIKFLGNTDNFILSKEWLLKIKDLNKLPLDEKAFNMLVTDIDSKKLKFQITQQEINFMKTCKDENLLDYILYRYKFKEYPKKKFQQIFHYIYWLNLFHLAI